jgi:hypothetical protein
MPSTIDSLTLDIGLTSDEFQAGVNKILGSMEQMQGAAAETGEGMAASFESLGSSFESLGSSVGGLALRFAGMFLGFKGLEGIVDYFKDLSREMANINFAAFYLGQSANELGRFGEVAKLAGGQAHDAIAGVRGLESAIFGLEFQGQMSESLILLSRLRVAYLDTAGAMLPIKDIALNAAAALQQMLPGDAQRPMRVQWAAGIFGAGGLANAVGGGLMELRKFYADAASDLKKIGDKDYERQMKLQQSLTELSYEVKGDAAAILTKLTPAIEDLIRSIETELIPTVDELITDLMDWMHPGRMLEKAATGPTGLSHPINDLAHLGAWLGSKAADFQDFWMQQSQNARHSTLATIRVPAQVTARMGEGTNLDALKFLHLEAGGDAGDPTWSKALTVYASLGAMPGGADAYAHSLFAAGLLRLAPAVPRTHALSTPSAPRSPPSGVAHGTISRPTSSTLGPRVNIGSMTIQTQATDANRMAADVNRALERKLLVTGYEPGLA